jgi:hypothetical protein
MDMDLHPARIDGLNKVTYEAAMCSLPDGCFVPIDGRAYLVLSDALLLWTPEGYPRGTNAFRHERRGRPIPKVPLPKPDPFYGEDGR